jgi:hypothetical protein
MNWEELGRKQHGLVEVLPRHLPVKELKSTTENLNQDKSTCSVFAYGI